MFVVLSPLASAKVGVISLRCLIGSVFVCASAHITATVFVFCAPSKAPLQRQVLVGWLVFVLKLRCLSHSLIKYPLIALLLCGFFFVPVKWGGVGGGGTPVVCFCAPIEMLLVRSLHVSMYHLYCTPVEKTFCAPVDERSTQ